MLKEGYAIRIDGARLIDYRIGRRISALGAFALDRRDGGRHGRTCGHAGAWILRWS